MSISLEKLGVQGAVIRFPGFKGKIGAVDLNKKHPYVVIVKQGLAAEGKKEVLVPVGAGVGAKDAPELSPLSSAPKLKHPIFPYKVNHVVFALDNSGSMTKNVIPSIATSQVKMKHVKNIVKELISSGLPKNTKITLIIFDALAKIATDGSDAPYEFRTDLETLIKTIDALNRGNGTNIFSALELSHKKIHELDSAGEERNLFILITDGEDKSYKEPGDFHAISRYILKSNTTSYLIGVGEDYKQGFLLDLAAHLGPCMIGHTPSKKNPFTEYLPTVSENLQSNDHYIHISTLGLKESDNYFPATPGIRILAFNPRKRCFEDYGGYQQNLASVSFGNVKKADEIKYLLKLKRFAIDQDFPPHELPIYDLDDIPPGLFEVGREAEERYERFLAALAQMNLDVEMLRKIREIRPDLVSEEQIGTTEDSVRNPTDASARAALYEAVADASSSVKNVTPSSPSLTGRKRMVNEFSAVGGDENSGESAGISLPSSPPEAHSGGVGPLDPNEGSIAVPPMEIGQINPAAYGKAPKKLTLEIIGSGKSIELNFRDKEEITFGRSSNPAGHVHISGPAVGRFHFYITRRKDEFYIKDNNSRNGTFVNDERITVERKLVKGDIIKVTDINMKVSF